MCTGAYNSIKYKLLHYYYHYFILVDNISKFVVNCASSCLQSCSLNRKVTVMSIGQIHAQEKENPHD